MASRRLWFIDFFRGIAIILMIIYHAFFDYYFLTAESFEYAFFAPFIGFLFIAGSGFSIRAGRILSRASNFGKRFAFLFLIALLISLATYIYDASCFIKFGIIHFFAVSALLIAFFPESKKKAFILSLPLILLGIYFELKDVYVSSMLLFPFGLPYRGFCSYDYYPLLPWLGFYMLSFAFGDKFFKIAEKLESKKSEKSGKALNAIIFAGKNSLAIYLLHQPVLFALFLLFLKKTAY